MRRLALTVVALLLLASVSAFADGIIDPNVGFCAPPATAAGCSTAPDTNPLGGTSFGMWSLGSNDSNSPWYMLIAVPEMTAGAAAAPVITSDGGVFTPLGSTADAGAMGTSFSGDIYHFAATNPSGTPALPAAFDIGNNSLNATNMFGPLEVAAYGGTGPNFFEIFVYEWSPGFMGATPYSFTADNLPAGTFVAAVAIGGTNNNIQFSTPFTTAGLVTPEPNALALLAAGVMGLLGVLKVRR